MSGIEVAGIVLAALSTAAGIVKNYELVASSAEKAFHPERYVRRLKSLLLVEYEIFRNTCELLLAETTAEAGTRSLLAEPGSSKWKKPELEVALKSKCGSSYSAVCAVLEEMQKAISELQTYLDAWPTGV